MITPRLHVTADSLFNPATVTENYHYGSITQNDTDARRSVSIVITMIKLENITDLLPSPRYHPRLQRPMLLVIFQSGTHGSTLFEPCNMSSDHVKLISSDEFEFIIDRKCAMASGTIKNMLSSPGNCA